MQYAKDVNGTLVYPTAEEFRGIPNWMTHDSALRSKGYMPLVGEDEREGFIAIPATWHKVTQSKTVTEPRQVRVPTYEPDPETGEQKQTGWHEEMQDKDIVYDTSYLQIDTWDYTPIPEPEPEPEPIRRYSTLRIMDKLVEKGIWSDVKALLQQDETVWDRFTVAQDLATDYDLFNSFVAQLRAAYGDTITDEVLDYAEIQ